jgi:membrane protein YqaA with SNARE-associated domain
MWKYLAVFLAALAVDLIPVIAPPAWTISVLLLVKFHLKPWGVLLLCVSGSTLGRYLLSLYIPHFSGRLLKRHKSEELEFLGKKLGRSLWKNWLFVFIYSVTPLSSTALFTAAGIAKVNPLHTLPAFFCGKFLSDLVMIYTGHYAAANFKDLAHGALSLKEIVIALLGLVVIGGFLFVDWRALLQQRKLTFNFKIWK